jgi:hypothetical protein
MPDEPDAKELEELEEHIDKARRDAIRDGLLPGDDGSPKFIDDGTIDTDHIDNDIVPPG